MTLDDILESVSYEDADLLIRFFDSLYPWQKSLFRATMKKQIRGEYHETLLANKPDAENCDENA